MYKNGFIKVMAATPNIIVGDITNNANEILNTLNNTNASVVVFPELSITGYTMSDLFYQDKTLKDSLNALEYIIKNNKHDGIAAIGLPLDINGGLFNVAAVLNKNELLGIVPKYYLPNNGEFSEKRWFISGKQANFSKITLFGKEIPFGSLIFKDTNKDLAIGVEICQDLWTIKTPADDLAVAGANLILNLSASTEIVGKTNIRRNAVLDHSRKQMSAYVYTTTGIFESSSESLFSSHKIIASMGEMINESKSIIIGTSHIFADINLTAINYQRRQDSNYRDSIFNNEFNYQTINFNLEESKDYQFEENFNLKPYDPNNISDYEHIKDILVASLVKKLSSLPKNNRKIVLGVSGGLDSTHALIVAYEAFKILDLPLEELYPVILPAVSSTSKSMTDAIELIEGLGLKPLVIDINDSVNLHLKDIAHSSIDTTYENAQARMRTLILMNLSNKYGGFVLGTGDLSEIALGFMTYNGDQMSMYAINSGLPKTLIQAITTYYANNKYSYLKDVLDRIVAKKISPELLDKQDTEAIIGSYLINDFIMYYHLECGLDDDKLIWLIETSFNLTNEEASVYVKRFINRFYNQQFKRSTLPEGPKVFSISLSPRMSYKLPSDVIRK